MKKLKVCWTGLRTLAGLQIGVTWVCWACILFTVVLFIVPDQSRDAVTALVQDMRGLIFLIFGRNTAEVPRGLDIYGLVLFSLALCFFAFALTVSARTLLNNPRILHKLERRKRASRDRPEGDTFANFVVDELPRVLGSSIR